MFCCSNHCLLIRKEEERKRKVILFLGIDNAGKSSLIKKIVGRRDYQKTIPTIGFAKPISFGSNLVFHEMGGSMTFRKSWSRRASKSDLIVFVIDISSSDSESRFLEAKESLNDVKSMHKNVLIFLNAKDKHQVERAKILDNSDDDNVVQDFDKLLDAIKMHLQQSSKNEVKQSKIKKSQVVPMEEEDSKKVDDQNANTEAITKVLCKNKKVEEGVFVNCRKEATIRNGATGWLPFCDHCAKSLKAEGVVTTS